MSYGLTARRPKPRVRAAAGPVTIVGIAASGFCGYCQMLARAMEREGLTGSVPILDTGRSMDAIAIANAAHIPGTPALIAQQADGRYTFLASGVPGILRILREQRAAGAL